MSIKLRELIRNVRATKTAAEERAVIQKECALIRTAFKSKDNSYRHRNVAKLLYIHMLGFPTHFGQMECLKLIASPNFPEKRIGYLGLMVLLDERQKVLMLVTNSLKQDFSHQNPYVVGLSLCALGNISTADMGRDLYNEVEKFFRNSNPYLRKKAALCAIRIVRKVPELVDEFVPGANALLNDQNNGVLVTGITLVIEMLKAAPKLVTGFRKSVPTLVRVLKNLLLGGYVNEYDVSGITDPFLQTRIIHLLRLLGHGNAEASEFMNDILAQVAINTEPTKNPGNAILYECVQTIMSIEAESGLRVLAINILGRFLQNRDNNIRYVALNTLCKVVERDTQAIQRHRNTVVECLKDADISIRRRALDLIYALVTRNNVKALVKELLNYLALTSGDTDFKSDLTDKICLVAQRFAPSKRWHIDTIVSVLAIAGNHTKDNVATDLMALIARSKTLHAYSVHRLYSELRKSIIHLPLVHAGLWCIGEYGESLVTDDGTAKANLEKSNNFEVASEGKVLDVIAKVMKSTESKLLTKEYALNCLVKLIVKFQNESGRLRQLIASYNTSMSLELQQRSCEYSQLFSDQLAKIRAGVVAKMPMPPKKKKEKLDEKGNRVSGSTNDKEEGEDSGPELDEEAGETNDGEEDEEERRAKAAVPGTSATKKAGGQQIEGQVKSAVVDKKDAGSAGVLPFDIFAGTGINGTSAGPSTSGGNTGATVNILESALGSTSSSGTTNPSVSVAPKNDLDILSELFAPGAPGGAGNTKPGPNAPGSGSLANILGGSTTSVPNPAASTFPFGVFDTPLASNPSPSPVKVAESKYPPVVVYESKGLSVKFAFEINSSQPEVCNVTASFSNTGNANFTGFDFQVAVPKFITLKMQPPSSTTVAAGAGSSLAPVTQQIRLENTQHGKKKLLIKVRIVYQVNGVAVTEDAQISQFPDPSS